MATTARTLPKRRHRCLHRSSGSALVGALLTVRAATRAPGPIADFPGASPTLLHAFVQGPGPALVRHGKLDPMYIFVYNSVMTKSYSVASARAKLSEIVNEVETGEEVEITRRGKKVAVVLSAARFARLKGDRVAFATAYESFRREHDLKQNGVEPDWAVDLRDRAPGRKVKL